MSILRSLKWRFTDAWHAFFHTEPPRDPIVLQLEKVIASTIDSHERTLVCLEKMVEVTRETNQLIMRYFHERDLGPQVRSTVEQDIVETKSWEEQFADNYLNSLQTDLRDPRHDSYDPNEPEQAPEG